VGASVSPLPEAGAQRPSKGEGGTPEQDGSFEGRALPGHLRMRGACGTRHPRKIHTPTHEISTTYPPPHPRPPNPCLKSTRSALGYTGRRAGEVGPAPGVRGRRKISPPGFAENGLPPATRGEARGFGPDPRLLKPERARRACLCGTQGGLGIGVAGRIRPSRQRAFGEGALGVGGNLVRPGFWQPDEHRSRKTLAEGPESRATTAERGAERCHIKLNLRGSFQRPVRI
jgi:hypothetical protein